MMGENLDAWQLWLAVRHQWRTGFDAIAGLDFTAVRHMAEMLEIDVTPCMAKKLALLEEYTLGRWQERRNTNGTGH